MTERTDLPPASRRSSRVRLAAFYAVIVLINLAALEITLRLIDFRDFRLIPEQYRLPYDHDPELGWYPVPGKRTHAGDRINSIGLRDIELQPDDRPTILFIGDSFVYGSGVKADERFSDQLREKMTGVRIVNAGVAAFGTDQQFLLLRRLWPNINPSVVVLIVCVDNDHEDNSTNARHGHTLKPYLAPVDGRWEFRGIPVPRSHTWYYYNDWLTNHLAVVRMVVEIYHYLRYPTVMVPDPTNELVGMMRDFVESRGARFLVGLQHVDPALEPFLKEREITYTRFDGAQTLPNDDHWSEEGHREVAERISPLLQRALLPKASARP